MSKKNIFVIVVAVAVIFGCAKDQITEVSSTGTTIDTGDDDYSNVSFDRTAYVTFSNGGTASVTGLSSDFAVTTDGNKVTIVNNSDEKVQYEISGSTSNGCLKIYSLKKQAIVLNGASITNTSGAAINIQGSSDSLSSAKRTYIVLKGSSTIADGSTYSTSSKEDEKAAIFSEGPLIFSGSGSLTVTAKGKSGIVSDDYVNVLGGTITVNTSTSVSVSGGDTLKPACMKGKEGFYISSGSLTLTSSGTGAKGISGDGEAVFSGGTVTVTVTGSNYGSSGGSGGGGNPPGHKDNSSSVAAKGIKFDGNITFSGSTVNVSCSSHEAIESKAVLNITGGVVYAYSAADDAINSSSDMTISGGYVGAYSTSNDALDANGNLYIKGGVVYAVTTAGNIEVAIDANSEDQKQLYVQGGTIVAIGGLEQGASLSQSCYQASSLSNNSWYSITVGGNSYAFKTPSSSGSGQGQGQGQGGGSSSLVVSGSSQPTLKSGVSVSGGTNYFNSTFNTGGTYSGGSSVSLSSYSGGGNGHF